MQIKRHIVFLFFISAGISCFGQLGASAGNDKVICPGFGIIVGGTPTAFGGLPPYTYSWRPTTGLSDPAIANPTATPSASITYTVTVRDDTGAVSTDVAVVYINDIAYVTAGEDTSICVSSFAQIGSGANTYPGITYAWSPGITLSDSTSGAPVSTPGSTSVTYTLTATTTGCAPKTDHVTVTVIPTPLINAGPDTTIQEGAVGILHGSGGSAYAWGITSEIMYIYSASCDVEPVTTTTYYLYGTDPTGTCPGYDDVTVSVEPNDEVVIYNTFTPNNDGNNDTWYIGNIQKYPDNQVEVYNRYGKLVYKTNGYANTFDGRVSGEELPAGTYFYDLNLGAAGTTKHHGTLTILR